MIAQARVDAEKASFAAIMFLGSVLYSSLTQSPRIPLKKHLVEEQRVNLRNIQDVLLLWS